MGGGDIDAQMDENIVLDAATEQQEPTVEERVAEATDLEFVLEGIETRSQQIKELQRQNKGAKDYIREVMGSETAIETPGWTIKNSTFVTTSAISLKEIKERHGDTFALLLSKKTESTRMTITRKKQEVQKAGTFTKTTIDADAPAWAKQGNAILGQEEE